MSAVGPGEFLSSRGTGFSREGGMSYATRVENVPASSRLKPVPHDDETLK
jgi:hypothetical protein